MAAAEYFSSSPMQQAASSPYQQQPTSTPHLPTYNQNYNHNVPHINTQAPPPYQENRPGVHFAPTPLELQQRHSFSGQSRPPQHAWNQPPQQWGSPQTQHNMALAHRPAYSYDSPPTGYGTPPQKPQFLAPHMRPYANPNSSQFSLDNGGYSSDPEHHRRRRNHRKRRDSGESRSVKSSSRSKNADAFVGAAGGGLIGDLIFPGLGTVGGAALGWFGGRDYGNHRKDREDKRAREQAEWEVKHRPHRPSRSRGSSHGSGSTYLGEKDDRYSYDRRHSHN